MPYKIIQTIERGKRQLCVIPNNWEKNNILHWPKKKVEVLLTLEDSCPDDSWLTMQCCVKRTGLMTYEIAEAELSKMIDHSDTEAEENIESQSSHTKSLQEYFDAISKSCIESVEMPKSQTETVVENIEKNNDANFVISIADAPTWKRNPTVFVPGTSHENEIYTEGIVHVPGPTHDNVIVENDKIDILIAAIETVTQNQNVLYEHVKSFENKVLQKISHLSAQVDTIGAMRLNQEKSENITFEKISNKEKLEKFEENLKIAEFRAEAKKQLSCVCGKSKGRGFNNAYTLSDIMLTREFLTQCSWAGGSKTKEEKICFKSFVKTIDFFFELVHESDNSFTKIECDTFLKNILRHSVNRNKPEIKRAASRRCRRKALKTIDNDSNENVVENECNIHVQPSLPNESASTSMASNAAVQNQQ